MHSLYYTVVILLSYLVYFLIQKIRGLNQNVFKISSSTRVYEHFRKLKIFNSLETKILHPTVSYINHFQVSHPMC